MEDLIELVIKGKDFSNFSEVSVSTGIDSLASSFNFKCSYNPDIEELKKLIKPYNYERVEIRINSIDIVIGEIEVFTPVLEENSSSIAIAGRSLTGKLLDLHVPKEFLSLQNLTLGGILARIGNYYDIPLIVEEDTAPIARAVSEPGDTCFDFIKKLCDDYSRLVYDNRLGQIVLCKNPAQVTAKSVYSFIETNDRTLSGDKQFKVSVSYDGTKRFSDFTAFSQAGGRNGNNSKIEDSSIQKKRDFLFLVKASSNRNLREAAERERALSIARSFSVDIKTGSWTNPDTEKIWRKGEKVVIQAPSVFLNQESEYIISDITYSLTNGSQEATLKCVLPTVYDNKIPASLPWEDI